MNSKYTLLAMGCDKRLIIEELKVVKETSKLIYVDTNAICRSTFNKLNEVNKTNRSALSNQLTNDVFVVIDNTQTIEYGKRLIVDFLEDQIIRLLNEISSKESIIESIL